MTHRNFKTGWAGIDQTEDPAYYIRYINRWRPQDDAPEQYYALFEALAAQAGEQILDVGCGTGGTTRALARHVDRITRIVGVDHSATMIAEAEKRAVELSLPLEYRVADAHQLAFDDNTFARCYSVGVFEIIDDPKQALAEMVRVVHPGGRLVIAVADLDASMIDATDKEVTRKILHYASDYEFNGWIGRQLPGYCVEMGLADIKVTPWVSLITDYERWIELWWRGWVEGAQAAGVISAVEAANGLNDLEMRHQAGRFLGTWCGFTVSASKPA